MRTVKATVISILAIGLLAGSAVGVTAQEDEAEPTAAWVTGSVVFGTPCEDPSTSMDGDVLQQRGFWCGGRIPQQWQSDDPRFTGTAVVAHDSDTYITEDGRYQVISSLFHVRNDDGSWLCSNADALEASSSIFDGSLQEFRMTCVGEGDYAGTTAILAVDFRDLDAPTKPFEGLIFPGDPPPIPEVPAQ